MPASRQANNVAVITIKGPIDGVTSMSVRRRMKQAVEGGADAIVFDIDTPGGEVPAVLDICTEIKRSPITNTVAWVNPTAYSGGAIIALACREIVISPAATMGDAAPIAASPLTGIMALPETERQKLLAPLLAEIVDSARRSGYDEMLVQGFVALGAETWLIRDKVTGEQYFVNESEYRDIFGAPPERGRSHILSGPAAEGAPSESGDATPFPTDTGSFKPALPGLSEETIDAVNLQLQTPATRPVFGPADRDRYELVHYATDGRTLLTLKEGDLRLYGFTDPQVTVRNDEDLRRFLGASHLARLDQSWSESLVGFMTQGLSGLVIRGLLIVVFLIALFVEMSMPGVGIPGLVALVALGGLVVPPLLLGASTWWAAAAILIGLGLVGLEIFVFPGFGAPGIGGLVLVLAGLVGVFASTGELFPGARPGGSADLAWAVTVVLLAVFVAGAGAYVFTRYTHKFPVVGGLILTESQRADGGPAGDELLAAMAPNPLSGGGTGGPAVIGAVGIACTPLRPSGSAEFGDRLVDVVSEFGFIDSGERVRVVSVSAFRVSVERAAPGPP
ncbi:MAG TPA: hypothetical protein DEB06_11700, partial [Phycisphaerales bacterium]|nr:hypothetical protein [Phycisphaerales bacterium]